VSKTIRQKIETDCANLPAEQRAQWMKGILRQAQDGHLVRIQRDDSLVSFWSDGKLPAKMVFLINPFPTIYQEWIDGHRVRQNVYDLWVGLNERPIEGFFYWLHSTIALLAIHTSPEQINNVTGLLREASKHGITAISHAESFYYFPHTRDEQVRTSLAKQMLYVWAATNFHAFTALASHLSSAEPEEENWWELVDKTLHKLADCDSSPLPFIPIPKSARFVFA
jgi:hypothetical protein